VARVAEEDRRRWDERYAIQGPVSAVEPPALLVRHADLFPTAGRALDLACGQGLGAVWLARRGLDVAGVDVSGVAIGQAREAARIAGVGDRCRFDLVDLDDGLPAGSPADVVLCLKFRDRRLDGAIIGRLAPGGLLAIAALSEVGAAPGPFRAAPGELLAAFAELEPIADGEGDGQAWLLARRRESSAIDPASRSPITAKSRSELGHENR
jgi:SAM-dependent methyltransferase